MEDENVRAIVCELCGSNELIKDGDVFVCQHCGTKYTTEEARKLLVEASVTIDEPVRVQGVATVDNLLRRADDFERQKRCSPYRESPAARKLWTVFRHPALVPQPRHVHAALRDGVYWYAPAKLAVG